LAGSNLDTTRNQAAMARMIIGWWGGLTARNAG